MSQLPKELRGHQEGTIALFAYVSMEERILSTILRQVRFLAHGVLKRRDRTWRRSMPLLVVRPGPGLGAWGLGETSDKEGEGNSAVDRQQRVLTCLSWRGL
ncbi:MAG: hypothetical protein TH68_01970 [Candidatus Synechococcus spongiarum 142]|uniref:Uncharacterized protein n=1 Tax=Candidatus Synechococcus spongiarum 142 TaxID=1608213 RepID=A0A6N3X7X4_9SYNE|nr:MAG: hypothetical protein TH68_01970 [Candidatus Synechococcus spongiarum 142]